MKLIILSLLLSLNIIADTHMGVEPELNYSKSAMKSFQFEGLTDQRLEVIIGSTSFPSRSNLGRKQKKKFIKALALLEPVLNSAEFKRRVLSYVRPGHTEPGFQKNYLWRDSDKRLTSLEVYNTIKEGNEKMLPATVGQMNINSWVKVCKWYQKALTWCSKVIGSTSPSSSKWIKLNWKFYKSFDTHQMVSNLVHEWIHLLGFLHGPSGTMRMEVPYVVGAIAGEIAKEAIEGKLTLE